MQWVKKFVERVGPSSQPASKGGDDPQLLSFLWEKYSLAQSETERDDLLSTLLSLFLKLCEGKKLVARSCGFQRFRELLVSLAWNLVRKLEKCKSSEEVANVLWRKSDPLSGPDVIHAIDLILEDRTLDLILAIVDTGFPYVVIKSLRLYLSCSENPSLVPNGHILSVLCAICSQHVALRELLARDGLAVLFSLISIHCHLKLRPFRSRILEVLSLVIACHISHNTVVYLHEYDTVSNNVIELRDSTQFEAQELVGAISCVLDYLRESCISGKSSMLLQDFSKAGGYRMLSHSLLDVEEKCVGMVETLLDALVELIYVGCEDLPSPSTTSYIPYTTQLGVERVRMGKIDSRRTVRNKDAFLVFHTYFFDSVSEVCRQQVLEHILGVYAAHYLNFSLLQDLRTLAQLVEALDTLSPLLQDAVANHVIFVCTVLNFVPFPALCSLSTLLAASPSPSDTTVARVCFITEKLIEFDGKYKSILRDAGMLNIMATLLEEACHFCREQSAGSDGGGGASSSALHKLSLMGDITVKGFCQVVRGISILLEGMPESIELFRQQRQAVKDLFCLVECEEVWLPALSVLTQLLSQKSEQARADMEAFIQLIQRSSDVALQLQVLHSLQHLLLSMAHCRHDFREVGGFLMIVATLAGLEGCFVRSDEKSPGVDDVEAPKPSKDSTDQKVELIATLLSTCSAAVLENLQNQRFFEDQIGYSTLENLIRCTGIMDTPHAAILLECLMKMAVQRQKMPSVQEAPLVQLPKAALVMVELLLGSMLRSATMLDILRRVADGRSQNQYGLAKAGVLNCILRNVELNLEGSSDDNAPKMLGALLSLVESIGTQYFSPKDLRLYFRMMWRDDETDTSLFLPLIALLGNMARKSDCTPFIQFDLSISGSAFLHMPSLGDRSWPPANGYSIMIWVLLESYGRPEEHVDILSITNRNGKSYLAVTLNGGRITLHTSKKVVHSFSDVVLEEGVWYHVAITHSRALFKASDARLYINGIPRGLARVSYISQTSDTVSITCGTPTAALRAKSNQLWRMGPAYLMEEVLSPNAVATVFHLGRQYCANFQGSFASFQCPDIVNASALEHLQSSGTWDGYSLGALDLSQATVDVPESRILFSLCGAHTSEDEVEGRVRVLNSADSNGTSWAALGGGGCVAIRPFPPTCTLRSIGGVGVVLFLMNLAENPAELEELAGLLVEFLHYSPANNREMNSIGGYEMLGPILCRKSSILSIRLSDILLRLCGIRPSTEAEESVLCRAQALLHIFLEFTPWKSSGNVQLQNHVLQGISSLLGLNTFAAFNARHLRELNVTSRILDMLREDGVAMEVVPAVVYLLAQVLTAQFLTDDLRLVLNAAMGLVVKSEESLRIMHLGRPGSFQPCSRSVRVINSLLNMLLQLIIRADDKTLYLRMINPQWLFHFIDAHLPPTTVTVALRLCAALLQVPKGGYNTKFSQVLGFRLLEQLLLPFCTNTELYYVLFCILLDWPVSELPDTASLGILDLFTAFKRPRLHVGYLEALQLILILLRHGYEVCEEASEAPSSSSLRSPLSKTSPSPASPTRARSASVSEMSRISWPLRTLPRPLSVSLLSHSKKEAEVGPYLDLARATSSKHNEGPLTRHSISAGSSRLSGLGFGSTADCAGHMEQVQQAVVKFLMFLFDSCPDFETACTRPEIIAALVAVVFPLGKIRLPRDPQPGRGRLDSSLALLFRFLVQIMEATLKSSPRAMAVLQNVTESVPGEVAEGDFLAFHSRMFLELLEAVESVTSRQEFCENERFSSNLARFCSTVIDKVLQGLLGEQNVLRQVFQFLLHLLDRLEVTTHVFSSSNRADLQILYRALNRLVIYMLSSASAPRSSGKNTHLYTLRKLVDYNAIVISLPNNDQDFFISLMFKLFRFFLDDDTELRDTALALWKLIMITRPELVEQMLRMRGSKGDVIDLWAHGFELLLQLQINQFVSWLTDNMSTVSAVFEENFKRTTLAWDSYETRHRLEELKHLRARMRVRQRRWDRRARGGAVQLFRIHGALEETRAAVGDAESSRASRLRWLGENRARYLQERWESIVGRYTDERGLWSWSGGSGSSRSSLERWRLDLTEGPYRMRKKLERDYGFYQRYPPLPRGERDNNTLPTSLDSLAHYEDGGLRQQQLAARGKSLQSSGETDGTGGVRGVPGGSEPQSTRLTPSPVSPVAMSDAGSASSSPEHYDGGGRRWEETGSGSRGSASLSRYFEELVGVDDVGEGMGEDWVAVDVGGVEEAEEIMEDFESDSLLSVEVEKEQSRLQSLLAVGDEVQSMFPCLSVKGLDRVEGLFLIASSNLYFIEGYTTIGGYLTNIAGQEHHQCQRWSREDIREVLPRRHMLRDVAMELFSADGRNTLLAFEPEDIGTVLKQCKAISSTTPLYQVTGDHTEVAAVEKTSVKTRLQSVVRLLDSFTSHTHQWVDGRMSNFQYLMHLNTLAGRSYNDLTQYPIFPWVLANYVSGTVDLSNPVFFRDLSKPMGALNLQRAEQFRDRYENSFTDGSPPFHYGSHYSSCGVVLYYLMRLEPFTTNFLSLQGGHWDHPDRVFHSIAESWHLNSEGSTSQVMELTPEFFYFPEFLLNSARFNFGYRHNKEMIGDVVLPPWAKNSSLEFVRQNMRALESQHVSEHLHEWIDLIFGYKQRGKAAVEALNVFHYVSYEGAVDVESIEDPIQRRATMDMILHFGNTPPQLSDRPHPKRNSTALPLASQLYLHPDQAVMSVVRETRTPVGQIRVVGDGKVYVCNFNRVFIPVAYTRQLAWGYPDWSMRLWSGDKVQAVWEDLHDGQVTSLTITEDGRILATGGSDAVLRVFHLSSTSKFLDPVYIASLCGHTCTIQCIVASRSYSVIVSGDADGSCIIWDLNRLRYVRALDHGDSVIALDVEDISGTIVSCSSYLAALWTINGICLRRLKLFDVPVFSTMVSRGHEWAPGRVLLTGHGGGLVKMWEMDFEHCPQFVDTGLKLLHSFSTGRSSVVTAVHISTDRQRIIAGDAAGSVMQWIVPESGGKKP